MKKMKSNYSFIISGEILCITDHCGPTDMSVTNNAENVIEEIKKDFNRKGFRMPDIIIYKDTEGNWDGINYDGSDATFYHLDTKSLTEALSKVQKR